MRKDGWMEGIKQRQNDARKNEGPKQTHNNKQKDKKKKQYNGASNIIYKYSNCKKEVGAGGVEGAAAGAGAAEPQLGLRRRPQSPANPRCAPAATTATNPCRTPAK